MGRRSTRPGAWRSADRPTGKSAPSARTCVACCERSARRPRLAAPAACPVSWAPIEARCSFRELLRRVPVFQEEPTGVIELELVDGLFVVQICEVGIDR